MAHCNELRQTQTPFAAYDPFRPAGDNSILGSVITRLCVTVSQSCQWIIAGQGWAPRQICVTTACQFSTFVVDKLIVISSMRDTRLQISDNEASLDPT